jgi:hypothetical protein
MPTKVIDYSNTVIYKIVCNDPTITDIYVGSTCNFTNRKYRHKSRCTNTNADSREIKLYKIIRDNGGWCNWSMLEIEKFSCLDGNEARTRERYWHDQLSAVMNSNIPNRTHREYVKDYYERNKDKINQCSKEYREKNKDRIKGYVDKNKDKIKENREKTYICICGSIITIPHKNRHEQTNKHKSFISNNTLPPEI